MDRHGFKESQEYGLSMPYVLNNLIKGNYSRVKSLRMSRLGDSHSRTSYQFFV